jgi:DNA-binding transcriptional ArsR family regulator
MPIWNFPRGDTRVSDAERDRQLGLRGGTLRGLGVTGGVIAAAGIVLAGTFAALTQIPQVDITEVGTAVALGVLLDTLVARTVLANPHRMRVIGALTEKRNYVSRLARDLGISRALLQVHLRKLEAAGLVSASVEVSPNGKAMKFYEVTPFAVHLTPETTQDRGAGTEHGKRPRSGAAMKSRTAKETAIICAAAVVAIALLTIPFELRSTGPNGAMTNNSRYLVWIAVAGVIALGMVLAYRYLTTRKRAQIELTGGEQYRQLAEEYRRLADLAITAQEHTDLKLGDVSAHLDYLREQNESLQKILKEVE